MYKRDYKNGKEEQGSNIDNANTLLPSKLDNSSGDNKDTTIRPTTAYIILYYVYVNLKELMNIKIQHILGTSWSVDGFPNIIKDVFSLIGDLVLYNIITLTAAKHIKELIKLRDFIELDVISNFAIGIIRTVITVSKDIEENFILKL
ncbi:hypothetical protein V2W45_1335918 [Cenococcum geophilum]